MFRSFNGGEGAAPTSPYDQDVTLFHRKIAGHVIPLSSFYWIRMS
jgi:hypothetical protein